MCLLLLHKLNADFESLQAIPEEGPQGKPAKMTFTVSVGYVDPKNRESNSTGTDSQTERRTDFSSQVSPRCESARISELRSSSATQSRGISMGSFRGSFRSKQGSIRSTHSVYDQSPATCDRVKSNAESSFPQPTLECPDMVADLDNEKGIEIRTKHLVGKTVKGVLMRRRGGYFIKWNEELSDAVFVTEECVERDIGGKKQKGLVAVVKCTIEKLGPSYAPWHKQHPLASKVELVERYWNSYHKRRQSELQTPGSRAITRKTASAKGYRPNRPNMAPRAESFHVRRGTVGSADALSVPTGYVPPKRRGQRRCQTPSTRSTSAPSDRNGSGKLVWRPRCLSQQVAKRGESSRFFRAS